MEENKTITEQLTDILAQIKIINHNINVIKEQVNQISAIQSIHNDSLIFLMNQVSDHSKDDRSLNQLTTINAKLNDNDLKISAIEDILEEIKTKTDNLPEQFQLIFDSLFTMYYDKKPKPSNPYGGIILS